MFDLSLPSAKRRPLCQRLVEPAWSLIVYCEIDLTRRFEYESQSSEIDQNFGTLAIGDPKKRSGGFVWKPNSVFQIGSFRFERSSPRARAESSARRIRPYEWIVASSRDGSEIIGPPGRVYG